MEKREEIRSGVEDVLAIMRRLAIMRSQDYLNTIAELLSNVRKTEIIIVELNRETDSVDITTTMEPKEAFAIFGV